MHTLAHYAMWFCIAASVICQLAAVTSSLAGTTRTENGVTVNYAVPSVFALTGLLWAMGAVALRSL